MILYVNSCIRKESRTDRIARNLLERLGEYKEVKLEEENLRPLDSKRLKLREELVNRNEFDNDIFKYAIDFKNAEIIVISAPYYDMSFPSLLKIYLENVYVVGLVSKYNEYGIPMGMCKAKKLYYVVTAGGTYNPKYSYDLIKDIALDCFGIEECKLIKAEELDIYGKDSEKIVEECINNIEL